MTMGGTDLAGLLLLFIIVMVGLIGWLCVRMFTHPDDTENIAKVSPEAMRKLTSRLAREQDYDPGRQS